ncbi:DUF397 domain-containing protein [Nocardia cyriacigeorgica]|uniref:DUF397 domain-containing protein n=1 Tax=Nocardia cyriacigeorgica TaxID=135487 RepID=UPI0018934E9A|nr:DUF397 domain-containing protein [Nocardia cyriacigeorgica]MBF6454186.1 DUF397 domain-containing protein [Nocardia cyriacigeorgica]MBF6480638.1 DUF397 domain-containing protein [Nocardia cyriacigeorgica]MBF6552080.1 DUF397 domain-containing protein [Nocardia cyriacigeorgica]
MKVDLSEAVWFKSSRSTGSKECVEIAHLGSGEVGLRDSKNPTGPALVFGPGEWDAFLTGIAAGRFDRSS